jgi:hypothetical protein
MPGSVALRAVVAAAAAAGAVAGCSGATADDDPDFAAARSFDRHPLYWVGERFERWDLEHVSLGQQGFSGFIYGTCDAREHACPPPLDIQIQPLCDHLEAVARNPVWMRREVRGAPLGTIDNAPVLFTNRVQVKVYYGEGADPGLPMRVLRALRSVNDVPPVIDADDPIPPAPRAVLDGTEECGAAAHPR